ncbi:hypothetical protein PIB30_098007 [Stylosanthes scabra]|uniref:Uncharacterized protein n=1 Tax=Stylosanthes scabra TaxID=79078 RepID=A0ABU6SWR4_9FABA|nr:hypothetical protein [Stylosanthes scabra]
MRHIRNGRPRGSVMIEASGAADLPQLAVPSFFLYQYIMGVNQLADVEIDKTLIVLCWRGHEKSWTTTYQVGESTSSGMGGKHKTQNEKNMATNSIFVVLQDDVTGAEVTANHEENVLNRQIVVSVLDNGHNSEVAQGPPQAAKNMQKLNPNKQAQQRASREKSSLAPNLQLLAQPKLAQTKNQTQPNPQPKPKVFQLNKPITQPNPTPKQLDAISFPPLP